MNWIRSTLVLSGVIVSAAALHKTYAPLILVGAPGGEGKKVARQSRFAELRRRVMAEQAPGWYSQ